MTDIVLRIASRIHDAPLSAEYLLDEAAAEITRLREALMPFAHYFNLNDCDERRDDDALEVPIGDLRRARAALTSTNSNPTEKTEGGAA